MDFNIKQFKDLLEEELGETLSYDIKKLKLGSPFIEFKNNDFYLEIHSLKKTFTIEVIEITEKGNGLGTTIYNLIESFCIKNNYHEIIARGFLESGANFWEKLNFKQYGDDYIKSLK